MEHSDPHLRARIDALDDAALARMLTVDAENYRDEALAIGREEANRRKLDLSSASSRPVQVGQRPVQRREKPALQLVEALPVEKLARFRVALAVLALLVLVDCVLLAWTSLEGEQRLWAILLANAVGLCEYLRIVRRLHLALQIATAGNYPVTPAFSVVSLLIPIYNMYFVCTWHIRVVGLTTGKAPRRALDVALPLVLNFLSLGAGSYSVSYRFALLFGSVWFVQRQLIRRTRAAPAS